MNYRRLDKNKLLKLNNNQAFVYACFSFKSDFNTGDSHVKQETLAEFCRCSTSKIQDYISVFKDVGLILSTKVHEYKDENGLPRRANEYKLDIPDLTDSNYLTIRKSLLEKDIPTNVIGYVLLLKCLCLNQTNTCLYTLLELSNKLQIGYSTLKGKNGLHQKAIDYGLIMDDKIKYEGKTITRHTIIDSNILLGEGLNIPDLNLKEHRFEKSYVEQYDIIRSCCLKHKIFPPKYDKSLLSSIMRYYQDETLKMALNQRLPKFNGDIIYSLDYILKILNLSLVSPNKEETTIIL